MENKSGSFTSEIYFPEHDKYDILDERVSNFDLPWISTCWPGDSNPRGSSKLADHDSIRVESSQKRRATRVATRPSRNLSRTDL